MRRMIIPTMLIIGMSISSVIFPTVGPVSNGTREWDIVRLTGLAMDDVREDVSRIDTALSIHDMVENGKVDVIQSNLNVIEAKVRKLPPGTKIIFQSDIPLIVGAADAGKRFVLGESVSYSAAAVITITGTHHVEIDLNGFSITGETPGSGTNNVISMNTSNHICIRNGRIIEGNRGIVTSSCSHLIFKDLTIGYSNNDCIRLSDTRYTTIKRCVFGPSNIVIADGIEIAGSSHDGLMVDCAMIENGARGVAIIDGSHNWAFRNCEMISNSLDGVLVEPGSTGVVFDRCAMANNNNYGIEIRAQGTIIRSCQVVSNANDGISLSSTSTQCVLFDNDVIHNGDIGIRVNNPGNKVHGNVSRNNTSADFGGTSPINPLLISSGAAAIAGSNEWLNVTL